MQSLLVLGASGFLGQHIARLLADEFRMFAIARSDEGAQKIKSASDCVQIVSLEEACRLEFDLVFNLIVEYGRDGAPLTKLIQSNLIYPLEILQAVSYGAVLNVSTALPENYSNYSLSKQLLEQALQHLEIRNGRRSINVHLHNMYGPGGEVSEIVGFAISKMLDNRRVEVSSCKNSRDFIFVEDVVTALATLSENVSSIPRGMAVEVGSGEATSLERLLSLIRSLIPTESEIAFGAVADNTLEPPVLVADTSLLNDLGWSPRYTLEDGLQITIQALATRQGLLAQ
jgi:nucleoside-diphosphate-sugar epimerase